jgi:hypothetical protein
MVMGAKGGLVRLAYGDKRLARKAKFAVILGHSEQPSPDQLDSPDEGKQLNL